MGRSIGSALGGGSSSTPAPPVMPMGDRLGAAFAAWRAARASGAGSGDSATKGKQPGVLSTAVGATPATPATATNAMPRPFTPTLPIDLKRTPPKFGKY
jgi:hypothetical protein